MKQLSITSPMTWGNGAYVVHRHLEQNLPEYHVAGYHPYWTFFPFILPAVVSTKGAKLIHTTPDYAIFFNRRHVPLVVSFQNYVLDRWMRSYSTWIQILHYATDLRLFTKMALRKAHAITAVSQFTARIARQDLNISDPIKIIYNGIDVNHFTPSLSPGHLKNQIYAFFSGNLTQRKGAHWLPSIAKHLNKNVRILYTHGLRTRNPLSSHPGLQSVGPVPFEEMPDRYRQMDILLMPTVREGLCLSVLEAMASGLPVVASNCTSLPEQIDHGKGGFLCEVGNVKAFAEKINLLADSPKLRREMGEYNRAKVERMFSLEHMVQEYHELFEETINNFS